MSPPPLNERSSPQAPIGPDSRRVAIFVEPSPFSHSESRACLCRLAMVQDKISLLPSVSGYRNRFLNLIRNLTAGGDKVTVVTPCVDPPTEYEGSKVVPVLGFRLPFYKSATLLLSLGLSVRVFAELIRLNPDVIHVSFPGVLAFACALYAKVLRKALVVSYHTHIPEYIPVSELP